jgi:hypothetical protein
MHFTVPEQVNDSDLSHGAASLPAYQAEPVGTAATSDELLVTVRPSTVIPAKLGTVVAAFV